MKVFRALLLLLVLAFSITAAAQGVISGTVVSKIDGKAISDCYVMLAKDGKIIKSKATDKQGT